MLNFPISKKGRVVLGTDEKEDNKIKIFVALLVLGLCTSVLAKASVPYLGSFPFFLLYTFKRMFLDVKMM